MRLPLKDGEAFCINISVEQHRHTTSTNSTKVGFRLLFIRWAQNTTLLGWLVLCYMCDMKTVAVYATHQVHLLRTFHQIFHVN